MITIPLTLFASIWLTVKTPIELTIGGKKLILTADYIINQDTTSHDVYYKCPFCYTESQINISVKAEFVNLKDIGALK